MAFQDYAKFDALGLADLVAKRDVTPAELVEEAIARVERHNPKINAVVFKTFDRARSAAKLPVQGPFAGVPFLLKDILGTQKGVPTRQGSNFLPPVPAPHDATLVRRFTAAGLISIGKTNVPEFGLVPTTEPTIYGSCNNPWELDHSSGGSSGGSGAAVAAGIVPIAHANDGGGSIRVPASANGLVGLKPTRGRNPLGPDLGDIMGGLVCEHVVTRSVRDTAAALDVTAGNEQGDPYWAPPKPKSYLEESKTAPGKLRIAFSTTNIFGKKFDPECVTAIQSTAKLLESLGHNVEEASPTIAVDQLMQSFMPIWASGLAMLIDGTAMMTNRPPHESDFQGMTWGLYQMGKTITAAQYQMCWFMLHSIARQVAHFHETYDVWMATTMGAPPVRNGTFDFHEKDPVKAFAPIIDYLPVTPLQNATGQPAITLPLHWAANGLPVGLHFAGRFGDETTLLRLAGQLEQVKPWANRHPPIWN
ncbi:MAG: amidase family protein [Alphaproteobacteria bacterium]|nr:amidase family protein [Alphaproteobacteria bacterium]